MLGYTELGQTFTRFFLKFFILILFFSFEEYRCYLCKFEEIFKLHVTHSLRFLLNTRSSLRRKRKKKKNFELFFFSFFVDKFTKR